MIIGRDRQVSKQQEWHNLTDVQSVITIENAFNYEMVVCPNYSLNPLTGQYNEEKDVVVFRASDDGLRIGNPVNPNTYHLNTPQDLFRFLGEVCSNAGFNPNYASTGTFRNRTRYYVSVELPEIKEVNNNNNKEFVYLNGFDGCSKLTELIIGLSTVKPVCQNTVDYSIEQMLKAASKKGIADSEDVKRARQFCSIRHSKSFKENLAKAKDIIESALVAYFSYSQMIEEMGKTPVRKEEAEAIYAGFLFPLEKNVKLLEDCELLSKRNLNMLDDLTNLFVNGAGNTGSNRLDLFNGFTEKFSARPELLIPNSEKGETLYSADLRTRKFVQCSRDGSYNDKKVEFFTLLSDEARLEKAYTDGLQILDAQPLLQELALNSRRGVKEAPEIPDFEQTEEEIVEV